ncbi:crossover junction endonuclease EME1-like isoform X1 [Centruroides sculpturatus]|uniref:crossover junction endonuclease EME1-like isoform X1 n=1 Tax=Centruroides sculpturatus TaxID=218467 RepID=UPI000C6D05EB|nr:crossover junction endonuclease EME1-like isoform X1 [Centruroides sculpturatus]
MDTSLIKPKEKNNFETHIANEDFKNEEKKDKQSDSESDSDMSLPAIECEIQLSSKAEKVCYDTSENENDDMNVICKNLQKGSKTQQKKFEKEQQKLLKEIEKEIRSYSKPDMALKIVSMEIDNEIEGLSNVSELWSVLQESGIKYKVEDNAIKSSILWFRDVIGHKISAEGKVNRTVERVPEEHLLIVFPTSQFIDMVAEMKQPSNVNMNSLISLTTYYETIYPEKKITYVAIGIEKYFRELKNKQNRNFRAQIRGDKYQPIPQKLSFSDIGEAVVCLQIQKNITLHLIDSVNELGFFLVSFSKAIAETPYKRERQNKFSWYAEGDTNKSVKVVDDASLSKLWKQQIEQFALVSKDVSEAIVVKYPTPQTLIQAYKECSTRKEAENLLKNIQVSYQHSELFFNSFKNL